jgi:predicted metalloprotease with PDZ domain
VIGIGLDLTLRDRSDGRITLDDFMRALWEHYGRPGARTPGYVETPYTNENLKAVLASVSGDPAFANDFFARYVEGHEVVDFAKLVTRAGFILRPLAGAKATAGTIRFQDGPTGARVVADVPFASPAYGAGLERDDVIVSLGGVKIASGADVDRVIAARKPGDAVPVVFERRGERVTATLTLIEDPHRELVAMEEAGQTPSDEQRKFRDRWLSAGF